LMMDTQVFRTVVLIPFDLYQHICEHERCMSIMWTSMWLYLDILNSKNLHDKM